MRIEESMQDKILKATITVVLVGMTIFTLIPLFNVLAMSFSSKGAAEMNIVNLLPVEFTLDSWIYIVADGSIWRSFFITLISTIVGTVIALIITALMAYPLSKNDFMFAKPIMIFIVITMVFKAPIIPYFLTLRGLNMYNNPLVLVLPFILNPYNLIIMRSFFKEFPKEVEEAANLDGAGYFQTLLLIVIPSSKAVLATVGLFYAVGFWNQFQTPLMFIQDTKLYPLQLKIHQILSDSGDVLVLTAKESVNYNSTTLQAASVVFAIIPIILIYPYLQKYFVKGAMLGSVKG